MKSKSNLILKETSLATLSALSEVRGLYIQKWSLYYDNIADEHPYFESSPDNPIEFPEVIRKGPGEVYRVRDLTVETNVGTFCVYFVDGRLNPDYSLLRNPGGQLKDVIEEMKKKFTEIGFNYKGK